MVPDSTEPALLDSLDSWLLPFALGAKNVSDLQRLDGVALLLGRLDWEQRQQLEQEAPTHIRVPSGSRIPVDYSNPEAPALAVRLQELFGMRDTPRIGRGRVPIVLHLLSPAQRPVQVTSDLSSFWSEAYFEVKKDLKGRYPKHYWYRMIHWKLWRPTERSPSVEQQLFYANFWFEMKLCFRSSAF